MYSLSEKQTNDNFERTVNNMDLSSEKDILLLRNCIILQIKTLNLNKNKSNTNFSKTQNSIETYEKMLEYLNSGDIESVHNMITNSINAEEISRFSKYIASTPPRDVAIQALNDFKKTLKLSNIYDEKKYKKIEEAFYKGNDDLKPAEAYDLNSIEYEEEPEKEVFSGLTSDIQNIINEFDNNMQKIRPKVMSPTEFKNFSASFQEFIKKLGIKKFQQYFDNQNSNKKVVDMIISLEYTPKHKSIYKTDLIVTDTSEKDQHIIITETARTNVSILNYYPNLCFSYIQACNCTNLEASSIDSEFINKQMKIFRESYDKLKEMAKFQIKIGQNNKIMFANETDDVPTTKYLDGIEYDDSDDDDSDDSIAL